MRQQPTPDGAIQRLDPAVEAALTDNRQAFLRVLPRHLGTADAAEEVLQQFSLRALSKAFHLRKRESVLMWLSRLLSTVLADYARREATRRRQETSYARQQAWTQEAVGLETMAVGGTACTGCSSEDSAVPGRHALVLETTDPYECVGLFGERRANPVLERPIRRAGRVTAQHSRWPEIVTRILMPRLRFLATHASSDNGSTRVPRERLASIGLDATFRKKWKGLYGIRDPPREAMQG